MDTITRTASLPSHDALLSDGASSLSLATCVNDVDTFIADIWTRRPALFAARDGNPYSSLLTLFDIDRHLLTSTSLRGAAFRLVRDGKDLERHAYTRMVTIGPERLHDVADPTVIAREFRAGATLVLQGLQRYWAPVTDFCREVEGALNHPAHANAYVTPPHSRALRVHYDTHDVFVLQSSGTKRWNVYRRAVNDPLATQRSVPFGEEGPPLISAELQPGQCLYIPRGFLHQAESTDTTSLHITVGVEAITWHDVLEEILTTLLNQGAEDPVFRGALPPLWANEDQLLVQGITERLAPLASWIGEMRPDIIAAEMRDRFQEARISDPSGPVVARAEER